MRKRLKFKQEVLQSLEDLDVVVSVMCAKLDKMTESIDDLQAEVAGLLEEKERAENV